MKFISISHSLRDKSHNIQFSNISFHKAKSCMTTDGSGEASFFISQTKLTFKYIFGQHE